MTEHETQYTHPAPLWQRLTAARARNWEITLTQSLDDLRTADEITRRFERRYWLSSTDFYELYRQGLLDDGERTEDYALWAGFHLINQGRQAALN